MVKKVEIIGFTKLEDLINRNVKLFFKNYKIQSNFLDREIEMVQNNRSFSRVFEKIGIYQPIWQMKVVTKLIN